MPENQDKVTAGFHQLLPVCKNWTDWRLLWKPNFPHLQLGFWRSLGDVVHSSIKLRALWKVLELAKVSCGQLLKLWELGRQQGGHTSQWQAGNSLITVMKENSRNQHKADPHCWATRNTWILFIWEVKVEISGHQWFSALLCRRSPVCSWFIATQLCQTFEKFQHLYPFSLWSDLHYPCSDSLTSLLCSL